MHVAAAGLEPCARTDGETDTFIATVKGLGIPPPSYEDPTRAGRLREGSISAA
jgi:hypothetical protein